MKINLYDYQEVAYNKIIVALRKYSRALLVMATGLGKTVVSAKIVEYFLSQLQSKPKILFLCHDTGILEQCFLKYQNILGDKYTYARFYGQKKNWNADKHNFVFATFQSKPHQFFRASHFDYIIVDESHHAKAETYDEVLDYFNVKWELGMTATPDREDQKDIRDRFGDEVVNYSLAEAIANGWVTPIEYKVMSDGIDKEILQQLVQDILVEEIKVNEKQLNDWIFVRSRTEVQCREILNYTNQNLKAIVFCNNIMHLEHVYAHLPNSVVVHSGQSAKMNALAIAQYEAGIVHHILVVDKFNEGIDLPDTDVLVFLRGTDSFRIWAQQLGRGLRKFLNKEKVIVLDFVANIERIRDVKKLVSDIASFQKTKADFDETKINAPLHIEGNGFIFDFTEEIVSVLSMLDYMASTEPVESYKTWQEASQALKKIGIKTRTEYWERYKENKKLPASPNVFYSDFPGWTSYLSFIIHEDIPDGWMTLTSLSKEIDKDVQTVRSLVGSLPYDYKQKHIKKYKTKKSGFRECHSPELIVFLKNKYKKKKDPPPDWKDAIQLRDEKIAGFVQIKAFVENYRNLHQEWFECFWVFNRNREFYSPELIKLIVQHFKTLQTPPPKDWITFSLIAKRFDFPMRPKLRALIDEYRIINKEWFGNFRTGNRTREYYHPNLVKIIFEKFKKQPI